MDDQSADKLCQFNANTRDIIGFGLSLTADTWGIDFQWYWSTSCQTRVSPRVTIRLRALSTSPYCPRSVIRLDYLDRDRIALTISRSPFCTPILSRYNLNYRSCRIRRGTRRQSAWQSVGYKRYPSQFSGCAQTLLAPEWRWIERDVRKPPSQCRQMRWMEQTRRTRRDGATIDWCGEIAPTSETHMYTYVWVNIPNRM